MQEQQLMVERENPQTLDPDEIRHYIRIYTELRSFKESLLERSYQVTDELSGQAQRILRATDIPEFEVQIGRIEARLRFWQKRFWDLFGIDLEANGREVRYADTRVALTGREFQLLSYLLARADDYVRPRQLIVGAWGTDDLSEEQLRTYLGRLRRAIENAALPVELLSDRRRGYRLRLKEETPS